MGVSGIVAPPRLKAAQVPSGYRLTRGLVRTRTGARQGRGPAAHAGPGARASPRHHWRRARQPRRHGNGGPFLLPPPPLPGAGASSPAGRGGVGVARKLAKGVRLRGASPLPPFTYISPAAAKEVGEGRESSGEATWWPRGSGPFSIEAGPSGPDDVLFPFG